MTGVGVDVTIVPTTWQDGSEGFFESSPMSFCIWCHYLMVMSWRKLDAKLRRHDFAGTGTVRSVRI